MSNIKMNSNQNKGYLYVVYYAGISKITATSRVPVLASVETVVAAVVGLLVFGQGISLIKAAGILLVLCSMGIMNAKVSDRNIASVK